MAYEIEYRSEDEMKDSGIEWLGKIPEEWSNIKFKYITDILTCGYASTPEYVDEDEGVPFFSAQNIQNNKFDLTKYNYIPVKLHKTISKYSKLKKGDLLQVRVGGSTTVGQTCVYNLDIEASYYVSLTHIRVNKLNFNKYVKYLCDSTGFRNQAELVMKKGAGVANLNVGDLERFRISVPSLQNQQKIANFLDIKTSEFDSIISKKEQLIKKLEEAKKSLISEVVTGKVKIVDGQLVDRKPEEMKDSGFEWLGMIPKGWEVKKIKYVSSLNKKTLSNNEKKELNINYIDIGSVDKTGTINQVQELTFEEAPSRARRIVTYKDTIVSTVRTYLKAISYIDKKYNEFICSTGFAVFTPNKNFVFPKFFYYMIMSEEYINQIMSNSVGVSYPAINASDITNFPCVLPNLEEQTRITNLLEEYLNKLNSIITKTKQQITKLKEANQSLISEAVTGKIDLRDWEIIESGGR